MRDFRTTKVVAFSVLVGKTLRSIENEHSVIRFITEEGETYRQLHYDNCCESCDIEEIHGDLQDLVGSPILQAEEVFSDEPSEEVKAGRAKKRGEEGYLYTPESETWTFYKLATIKGSVTIRWYGRSNGYYSETATFEQVLQ